MYCRFGRNFFCRYDYENVASEGAAALMTHLRRLVNSGELIGAVVDNLPVVLVDEFEYTDPIDGSLSKQQGIRVLLQGGSRIVYRQRYVTLCVHTANT